MKLMSAQGKKLSGAQRGITGPGQRLSRCHIGRTSLPIGKCFPRGSGKQHHAVFIPDLLDRPPKVDSVQRIPKPIVSMGGMAVFVGLAKRRPPVTWEQARKSGKGLGQGQYGTVIGGLQ